MRCVSSLFMFAPLYFLICVSPSTHSAATLALDEEMPHTHNDSSASAILPPRPESSDLLLTSISNVKRHTVAAACEQCRKRKAKCDGQQPCVCCTKRGVDCVFESSPGETPLQARKRKHHEALVSRDQIQQLHDALTNGTEEEAQHVLGRLRNGETAEHILGHIKQRRLDSFDATQQEHLRRSWLRALIRSTASLPDVVRLAMSIPRPLSNVNIPQMAVVSPMKRRVLKIASLGGEVEPKQTDDGFDIGPPIWVPAEPWVSLIKSDEAVSHLISLYFNYINPYWRVIEQDYFVQAMRSKETSSFCSPLLVHAILAMASMFTEIDEAFATANDLLTRGLHFHLEATRLWHLKDPKPTVATIQAGVLMSLQASMRGQDKAGWHYLKAAADLFKALDIPDTLHSERLRACLRHSVVFVSCTHIHTTLRPYWMCPATPEADFPDLYAALPDTIVYWDGYPLIREPLPFRQNRLIQERQVMTRFLWDAMTLLFPGEGIPFSQQVVIEARDIAERYDDWWTELPMDFLNTSKVPISVFELHAQYYSAQMSLCSRVLEIMASNRQLYDLDMEGQFRRRRLWFAHRTAATLVDLRSSYGSEILPLFMFQVCAVALSSFLLELASNPAESQRDDEGSRSPSRERIDSNFEECFRCLLAAGMHQLLPRAVSRIIYHTARQLKVRLPRGVRRMLQLVADTAWQISDLQNMDAAYPSYGIPEANPGQTNDFALEDLLRKWEDLEVRDKETVADVAQQSEDCLTAIHFGDNDS